MSHKGKEKFYRILFQKSEAQNFEIETFLLARQLIPMPTATETSSESYQLAKNNRFEQKTFRISIPQHSLDLQL